jgi:hypothetical protein
MFLSVFKHSCLKKSEKEAKAGYDEVRMTLVLH